MKVRLTFGNRVAVPGVCKVIGEAIVESDFQSAGTEGVDELADDIALAVLVVDKSGDVVRGDVAIPEAPAAGMFDRENAVLHARRTGRLSPLPTI